MASIEAIYSAVGHFLDEVIFVHDEDRNFVFVSPSVEHVLGYTPDDFIQLKTYKLIHPDDLSVATEQATEVRAQPGNTYRSTVRLQHADEHYIWCEIVGRNLLHTEIKGVVSTLRDVSDRRELEEQLLHQATHDELSGLANRRKLLGELGKVLKMSPVPHAGLLMIDLDGFKFVNDTFGHLAGDELLKRCAENIQAALRPGDVAARLGGDEFAVLCQRINSLPELTVIAQRVLARASGEYALDEGVARIGLSIGAVLAQQGDTALGLMSIADSSLYKAKAAGKGCVVGATR